MKVSVKTLVETSDLLIACAVAGTVGVQGFCGIVSMLDLTEDFGGNFTQNFGKIFAKN